MILLFKIVPKCSAEMSSVPKHKRVMCLKEKVCVLSKVGSGMSYSAVPDFNVNESTVY